MHVLVWLAVVAAAREARIGSIRFCAGDRRVATERCKAVLACCYGGAVCWCAMCLSPLCGRCTRVNLGVLGPRRSTTRLVADPHCLVCLLADSRSLSQVTPAVAQRVLPHCSLVDKPGLPMRQVGDVRLGQMRFADGLACEVQRPVRVTV